jgi:hypothetical protein
VEITNEKRGWHLHAHWLVNARWVDVQKLAVTWGRLVNQDFAIVKVLDARDKPNYVREVSKYVVKGNQLAKWHADEINEFVRAIKGRRFFFVFGEMFKHQAAIRCELNRNKPETVCDCGSFQFAFETETQSVLREIRQRSRRH